MDFFAGSAENTTCKWGALFRGLGFHFDLPPPIASSRSPFQAPGQGPGFHFKVQGFQGLGITPKPLGSISSSRASCRGPGPDSKIQGSRLSSRAPARAPKLHLELQGFTPVFISRSRAPSRAPFQAPGSTLISRAPFRASTRRTRCSAQLHLARPAGQSWRSSKTKADVQAHDRSRQLRFPGLGFWVPGLGFRVKG